jgi:hypothetical protein
MCILPTPKGNTKPVDCSDRVALDMGVGKMECNLHVPYTQFNTKHVSNIVNP